MNCTNATPNEKFGVRHEMPLSLSAPNTADLPQPATNPTNSQTKISTQKSTLNSPTPSLPTNSNLDATETEPGLNQDDPGLTQTESGFAQTQPRPTETESGQAQTRTTPRSADGLVCCIADRRVCVAREPTIPRPLEKPHPIF